MKKIFYSLILVVGVFALVGCGKTNKLVGTWEGKTNDGMNTTFTFKKDGKVDYSNEYGINSNGTYEIKDSEVTIKLESWDKEKVYKFEVKDKKLSLTATDSLSPSYAEMVKK